MKKGFLPTNWNLGNKQSYTTFIPLLPKKTRTRLQLLLLGLFAWFLVSKDISIELNLSTATRTLLDLSLANQGTPSLQSDKESTKINTAIPLPLNVSLLTAEKEKVHPIVVDEDVGNAFTNTTYTSDLDKAQKQRKQMDYVKRFAKVARAEMKHYGIPASITMAQALIESDCGDSRLARENHNHFGIKCFSKKCKKGHCSNFTDDSHKDFFRKYANAWESYRAHSQLLQKARYKSLYKLSKTDYKSWAHGLKKAGYATDKQYAYKLIALIDALELYRLDRVD